MTRVDRRDIVDIETYEEIRPRFREDVLAEKAKRRIHVEPCFTFLFENILTIRYQIQEMMRTERIVKEAEIGHEIETYNGLLGGPGELGCTLLVELDDPAERAVKLREWYGLPEHLYARLPDGTRVRPVFDLGQRGADRLSSVQYLKFPVGKVAPVAIGIELPGLVVESSLSSEQREALARDLGAG